MADNQRNIKIGKLRAVPIESIGDNSVERIEEARHSGKIILPSFVLRRVYRMDQTLMIFKIINDNFGKFVFCGVFKFDGEEQKVSVPLWILKQLHIESGDKVSVELVMAPLQKGLFAKFEPMTRSFLQISNPKAVLEHCLRNYVCMSREDVISIYYNRNVYELKVIETLPSDTIIINECDLTVDFQEMKESIELPEECDLDQIQSQNNPKLFEAFSGAGQTTGGKKVTAHQNQNKPPEKESANGVKQKIGIPDYDYKIGTIFFKRYKKDLTKTDTESKEESKEETKVQKEDNVNTDEDNTRMTRRPVTRSQTQQKRNEENRKQTEANSSSESKPSDQKRRKKNTKNNRNQI